MIDDNNPPIDPADDPALDHLIESSGRFAAPMDLEDRVIRHVSLPLPAWAAKVRNFGPWLVRSAVGRLTILAAALGLVTSITSGIRLARTNAQALRDGMTWLSGQVNLPAWPDAARAFVSSTWAMAAAAIPGARPTAVLAVGAVVVGVSAVGLYITAGPPAFRSRHEAR